MPSPPRIGIDCRKILDYGIGTIISNLVESLGRVESEFQFYLLGDPGVLPRPGPNFLSVRETSAKYSLGEILSLPLKALSAHLDLLHWPHYVSSPLKLCRHVVSIHDLNHLLFPQFLPSRRAFLYARAMLRLSAKLADRIITATSFTKQEIVEYLGVGEEKVAVIHNGVSELFRPLPPADVLPVVERDFQLQPPFLLYVGSLRQHKNVGRLLEAFSIIRAKSQLAHTLALAGDHPVQGPILRQKAEDLGLENAVRFLGLVDHKKLPALYSSADLFVFPSLYEGFGLPVLEAMASGTPVCASNIPAIREVAADCAEYFDPHSPTDIASAIANLLLDSSRSQSLAQHALKRARSFSWLTTARETLAIYREALGKA